MDISSKIYIEGKKGIINRNSENERIKTIEIYGDVETLKDINKIHQIKYLFKKGTIKGSCIKDELYVIDDKYGFYHTGCNWQFCEFNIITEKEEGFDGEEVEKIYYDCNPLKEAEIKDIYELLSDNDKLEVDNKLSEYTDEYYKNSNNRIYFEFDIDEKGRVSLYTEYKECCFSFEIDKRNGLNVYLDGEEIKADRYWEIKEALKEKYNNEIVKYLDKNIIKLNNGFIYNKTYYEDFEEVKNAIDLLEKGKKDE